MLNNGSKLDDVHSKRAKCRNIHPQVKRRLDFGVCLHTLRRWEKNGKIQAIKTPSGQRRYDIASYTGISNERTQRTIIAYARVSSRGQKADLDRQAAKLLELYPNASLITDIASGLNFKRTGLRAILGRQSEVCWIGRIIVLSQSWNIKQQSEVAWCLMWVKVTHLKPVERAGIATPN